MPREADSVARALFDMSKSPIDAALDRAGGSSYYYAHERRTTDDIAAPLPPTCGTKIDPSPIGSRVDESERASLAKKSDYYYAHGVSDAAATEPRAPMPPDGGTLLAVSRRAGHVSAPAPEPLREYYFEDADRSDYVTVTFPLRRVGATHGRGAAARERAAADALVLATPGRISSEDTDVRGDGVYVTFGKRNSRSFEVEVIGHVDEEHDPDNPYEPEPVGRHLRFRCERTFDEFIAERCEWKVLKNAIKVRLCKNPDGPNKYRAWKRVIY